MKLLFLRSQLADVEVGLGDGADLGDMKFRFNLGLGDRFDAGSRRRSGGLGFRITGSRASGRMRRLGRNAADGFGDFLFERAAWAGLHGHGGKAGKNFEGCGERCGGGLRTKHRGKRVGGFAAGTGRYDVVDGLLEFVTGALDALEVVAESASDGLFDGIGFRCHTGYWGRFARCSPHLPLWGAGRGASTGRGRGCD
jgi:hypothetical protein